MKRTYLAVAMASLTVVACSSSKKASKTPAPVAAAAAKDTLAPPPPPVAPPDTAIKEAFKDYRASAPILNELRHTTLHVKFDWKKCYMYGQATITLRPHYYATDSLTLYAKGMDIKEVALLKG